MELMFYWNLAETPTLVTYSQMCAKLEITAVVTDSQCNAAMQHKSPRETIN